MRDLIALISLMITGLTALAGVWWGLEQRIQKQGAKSEHDRRNTETSLQAKITLLEKELAQFQREVAKEYPDFDKLKEVEERLSSRIESISDKMDEMPKQVIDGITQFIALKNHA